MGQKVTAAALAKLEPGERLADVNSLYWRANRDGSCTAWQRLRRAGKVADVRALVVSGKPTARDITAARLEGARLKTEALEAADQPTTTAPAPATDLGPDATFGEVWADLLRAIAVGGGWSERNTKVNVLRIKRHIEPSVIWDMPIKAIQARTLSEILSPIAVDAPDQAKKLRQLISKTIVHAAGLSLVTASPVPLAASMMRNVSKAKAKKHHPALLKIEPLRELVRSIASMNGAAAVRNALLMQAHTTQRSSEVTNARWSEFDLESSTWTIPRSRMKVKTENRPDQVLVLPAPLVKWIRNLPKSESGLLFPGIGDKELSENTLNQAMRRQLDMAGKHVPHGFRSSLKTLASKATDETGRPMFSPFWVEAVLDHLPEDAIEAAYRRDGDIEGAARVLSWWCNELGVLS